MREIKEFLSKLSLSNKEIKVYLTGLKYGPMYASRLAKECEFSRPNIYDVFKKLQKKGLCNQLGSAYGRKFEMVSAEDLEEILERRQQENLELESELKKILPLFQSIQGKLYEPYPRIEFFEGAEGIKKMISASLQCETKMIKTAASVKNWVDFLGKEFTNYYVKKRVEKDITSHTLRLKKGEVKDPFYQQHELQKREVRYVPDKIKLDATIILFDNKIALITIRKEDLGILITSKSFSSTLNSWFDFLWSKSKKTKS